jgi:error-prone DNA polymerase
MTRVRLDPGCRYAIDQAGNPLPPLAPFKPPPVVVVDPPPRALIARPRGDFVHTTVRSSFSFLQGASHPGALVQRAAELGYDVMALTDRDGLYGVVRAYEEAKKQGLRLIVGAELTLDPEDDELSSKDSGSSPRPTLFVHVQNQAGYTNLCRVLTQSHARHVKGKARGAGEGVPRNCFAGIPMSFIAEHAEGLWATLPLPPIGQDPRDVARLRALLHEAFGERASLGVHRGFEGGDRARIEEAILGAQRHGIEVVATHAVHYAHRRDKRVLDVLHCIREGMTLDQAGRALSPNAEAHLKSEPEMRRIFSRLEGHAAWLARSRHIAEACTFDLKELHYRFPFEIDEPAFPGETADEALRRLTYEGAKVRLPDPLPVDLVGRIEKELEIVRRIQVAPYFLSVQVIVEIAKAKHILCQGRGSAANSVVCFCLGITAVNPLESNMLFERFLSEERKEPPDIDVDFEHDRREEVIQEIYARYGRDRAAMVCEVISYRGKSALREVGKVFGFSLEQTDRLSGLVEWWDRLSEVDGPRLSRAGFDPNDGRVAMALGMARAIVGFPRHLSIHVGGFVLSAVPLYDVAPIEPATMPDRTIIPWDKDDLDTLGFFKVDVLGLGMLTALRKSLALIQDDPRVKAPWPGQQLARIPREDPAVYAALGEADTVGVFQIESRAQMSMLPRLKPKEFYDLVVEVAIVRPGPIQGGMVHPYLRRRSGQESPVPPHPVLASILERTLGVPLFQEQVMQIAIVGAGYTGGEADSLRRDMAAWRRSGKLERHRERLRQGFLERGITEEFAARLFEQIQGFGEYGFPESHAASFALLVYASAWIKVHHPAAFAVGLLNSQPMGFYSPSTILNDAQKHGVVVLPVSATESDWDSTLVDVPSMEASNPRRGIRVGLRVVRGFAEATGRRLVALRKERAFATVADLRDRVRLDAREVELLAEAGALEGLVEGRREAIWKVQAPRRRDEALFAGVEAEEELPVLAPLSRAEQLAFDYERTGLSVTDHPMALARTTLPESVLSSRAIAATKQGRKVTTVGLVICRQRPGTASGVVFITMEDEHGFVNLIVYSRVFDAFRHVATAYPLLVAHGIIEREGSVVYVVVQRLEPLSTPSLQGKLDGLSASRDFH